MPRPGLPEEGKRAGEREGRKSEGAETQKSGKNKGRETQRNRKSKGAGNAKG